MAYKETRWRHGITRFVLPPLPAGLLGRQGCSLHCATFDSDIGEEVYALYLEEPGYAEQFERVTPFNLIVHTGMVGTPYGAVAFILWNIAAASPQGVMVEQYLNPQNIGALRLLASAANQSHLKLIVANNRTGTVTAMVDYENVFALDEFVSKITVAIGHEPEGDFGAAMQYVMDQFTIQDLIRATQRSRSGLGPQRWTTE